MNKYVAFLRAINVGGHSIIKMEDLKRIESRLEGATGYKIQLFVRTMREVKSIADQDLYTPKDNEIVHVVFLDKTPEKKMKQALKSLNSEADDFSIKGREVYNLRRDRDKSVFSNNFIEKLLGIPATTRNLRTIKKIADKYN